MLSSTGWIFNYWLPYLIVGLNLSSTDLYLQQRNKHQVPYIVAFVSVFVIVQGHDLLLSRRHRTRGLSPTIYSSLSEVVAHIFGIKSLHLQACYHLWRSLLHIFIYRVGIRWALIWVQTMSHFHDIKFKGHNLFLNIYYSIVLIGPISS